MQFLNSAGLAALRDWVNSKLADKVNSVSGKQLSTEDYTTEEKAKLLNIPTITEVGDGISLQNGILSNAGVKWPERKRYVGKNLLENKATSQTINGVTFTVNDDKSITVNGTATANVTYRLVSNGETALYLDSVSYTLSVGVAVPQGTYFTMVAPQGTNRDISGGWSRVTFTPTANTLVYEVRYWIPSGTVISNLTLYPMLRYADIQDDTYEPYIPPNDKIAEKAFSDVSWEDETVFGAKNRLPVEWNWRTIRGVTFTSGDNETVVANGTATDGNAVLYGKARFKMAEIGFKLGDRIALSGCPSDGGAGKYYWGINRFIGGEYEAPRINNTGLTADGSNRITLNQTDMDAEFEAMVVVDNGFVADGLIFNPMITLDRVYDANPTYAPYAMTNRELTEKVRDLETSSGSSYDDTALTNRVATVESSIGTLSSLTTAAKTSLVDSVNEVFVKSGANNAPEFKHYIDNARWYMTMYLAGKPMLNSDGSSLGAIGSGYTYMNCQLFEMPEYFAVAFGDATMQGAGTKYSALPTNVHGLYLTISDSAVAAQLSFYGGGEKFPITKSSVGSSPASYQNYSIPLEFIYLPAIGATDAANPNTPASFPTLSYWDNTNKSGTAGTVQLDMDRTWMRILPVVYTNTGGHTLCVVYRLVFKTAIPKLGCIGALTPNNWYIKMPKWVMPLFSYK